MEPELDTSTPLSRRRFLSTSVLGVGGALLSSCVRPAGGDGEAAGDAGRIRARPRRDDRGADTTAGSPVLEPGLHRLGLAEGRDGMLYVPPSYQPDRTTALLVGLHGAGHGADEQMTLLRDSANRWNFVVLAPESRGETWNVTGNGEDIPFIERALGHVFEMAKVDRSRIWIEGFSDGASSALSIGLTNGDLFRRIVAFSPGYLAPNGHRGRPRIFVSHGTRDTVLPIDRTSRPIVAKLKEQGYDVRFDVFDGPHTVPADTLQRATRWLTAGT